MLDLKTDKMLTEVRDGVGWVTFNNPERRNAVSLEMWQALGDILEALDQDDSVRVAVLRGAGDRAFVSGADISEFDTKRANSEQRREYGRISKRAHRGLAQFTKPLVAMIHGYCIGGGLVIALACDVRFATPGSRFGVPAAKLGLGYDYSGVAALARLVGPAATADILYSARQLKADEALRLGLVNFVVPDEELETRVVDYAQTVARNAPLTIRAVKAALGAYAHYTQLEQAAAVETLVSQCFDSEDYKEGRQAFREKRAPSFKGK